MKERPQLDLFVPIPQQSRTVIAVETKIPGFGNRTDLIVVDGSTVRGVSLLESDNPDVRFFNNLSESPYEEGDT